MISVGIRCVLVGLLFAFSSANALGQMIIDSLRLELSDTLFFDFGKADLRAEADSTLRKLAPNWTAGKLIYLTAHTDSVGSIQANEALALRRAEAVRMGLKRLGIPDSVLLIDVFGERQPLSREGTEAANQRNRRVTIGFFLPQRYRRLTGKITGADSIGIDATLLFNGKWFRDSIQTDSGGRFRVDLPVEEVIKMEAFAPDHFFASKLFKVDPLKPLDVDIQLDPAGVGLVADIPNLFFLGDKDILKPASRAALPQVLRFMQVNPDFTVEIAGHVNFPDSPPLPKGTFSFDLSERRAKRVYNYLIERGIDPQRLTYKAYSNFEMRFPQPRTAEESAANRRVEIRVTGRILK